MLFIFSITLFLSATLLFWVQPMFGKMVLPILGSSPSVWNACMVFFQASLLCGYIYAHASTRILGVKRQSLLQIGLLFLPLLVLPISISNATNPPTDENPIPWLLMIMATSVGLPFFVVSATAPLLQKWFSSTSHKDANDPYFLYVASNFGSILGLIAYPLFLESNFRIIEQTNLWKYGYWILLVLIMACAMFVLFQKQIIFTQESDSTGSIKTKNRIWWVLLSFVPSSLLLGVTLYLSTDISAIPLLWVIPLILYLLSFILVFSKKQFISHKLMIKLLPIFVLPVSIYIISAQTKIVWLTFLLHLVTFFIVCMICHGELVRCRPPAKHLTEFYLWVSVGGFLGGLFNAIVAPLIFKTVIEYPLALVFACLLSPGLAENNKDKTNVIARSVSDEAISLRDALTDCFVRAKALPRNDKLKLDAVLPLALGFFVVIVSFVLRRVDLNIEWLGSLLTLALPAIICYLFHQRPLRFGLGIGVFIFVSMFFTNISGKTLYTERSFFCVHRVVIDSDGKYRNLIHGRIIHGKEIINSKRPHDPLTYYHKDGPIGQFFNYFNGLKIGAIGLGAGSLAYYGKQNQEWTFFEIDPAVKKIATNEKYFTFLHDSNTKYKIILGDGRLSVKKSPDKYFDLLILDAFSSDAIPMHLITQEAIKIYLSKIKENGIIAFHISNRFINLQPVLANLACSLDLLCLVNSDLEVGKKDRENGREPSIWVIMTSKKTNLGKLANDTRWKLLSGNANTKVWSDDFSNILSVFNWGRV